MDCNCLMGGRQGSVCGEGWEGGGVGSVACVTLCLVEWMGGYLILFSVVCGL